MQEGGKAKSSFNFIFLKCQTEYIGIPPPPPKGPVFLSLDTRLECFLRGAKFFAKKFRGLKVTRKILRGLKIFPSEKNKENNKGCKEVPESKGYEIF